MQIFGLSCTAKHVVHGVIAEETVASVLVVSTAQEAMIEGLRMSQSRLLPLGKGYYDHKVILGEAPSDFVDQLRSLLLPKAPVIEVVERVIL